MATASAQVTRSHPAASFFDRLRALFPFGPVVLPWLVARVVLVPILVVATPGGGLTPDGLLSMDGQWFRLIALDGYDRPYVDGFWSEYPFFPLFPAIGGALMRVGVWDTVALAGVSWLAALVAGAGAYRLAVRHLDARAAPWAPWFLALAPGAVAMVLGYSDSLFVAGLVWALVLAEDRRWWAAGFAAAVATASRPNGVLAVVAAVVIAIAARAGWRAAIAVATPSILFLVGWAWYLADATGDPIVFWSAKDAWDELSLAGLLADPFDEPIGLFHLVCFLTLAVPYATRVRRQPLAWAFVVVGVIGPPLVLGVEGLARYAAMAFPLSFAMADVVVPRSRPVAIALLLASTTAMAVLAALVVSRSWVP